VPRRKPDQTVVHRIELGTWERDHAEGLILSKQIDNYVRPVALGAIGAASLYGSYQLARWVTGLGEVPDKIEQWFVEKWFTWGGEGAELAGDVASTIIDPQGKKAERSGTTIGEKLKVMWHWFWLRQGVGHDVPKDEIGVKSDAMKEHEARHRKTE